MKQSRVLHFLLLALVIFTSTNGCRTAPPPVVTNNLDELIRNASILARQHADEALAAKLAAEAADGDELRLLLSQVDEAAQQSKKYADEAASLQSQIDDLAARSRVADEVQRAQQAADEAAAQRAAINRIFLNFRKQMIHSYMDDVTNRIVRQVDFNGEASEEQLIKWLDEIVAGSFCDLLVDTVATGELPTQPEVQDAVEENAVNSSLDISGIYDIVSKELIDVYRQLASGKTVGELESYKEACKSALTER
ncbi:MAG: hypothetical protein ABIU06_01755 [Anaerolineales bacterium]